MPQTSKRTSPSLSVVIVWGFWASIAIFAQDQKPSPVGGSLCVGRIFLARDHDFGAVLLVQARLTDVQEADCVDRDPVGSCLPRQQLHHLFHHHEFRGRNVNVVEVITAKLEGCCSQLEVFIYVKLGSFVRQIS